MPKQSYFDQDYYQRYYHDQSTRVTEVEEHHRLGRFVASYIRYLEQPIKRVLDLGCGVGYWQQTIAEEFPQATYQGVEHSKYLCDTYGWQNGSAVDFKGRGRYDLVICQDVIQYFSATEVSKALANLARLCRGVAFVQITTAGDWRHTCDQTLSDNNIQRRSADWYRRRIQRHFKSLGGGLLLPKDSDLLLYELQYL